MAVERVTHFGVCVRDLARGLRFYREALGFEPTARLHIGGEPTATLIEIPEVDLEAVYLERDGLRLELLHYPHPGTVGEATPRPMNQPGLTHFAVRVVDLDDALARVEAAGGRVLKKTRIFNPDFEAHVVYVLDPDGTRIELIEAPGDPAVAPGIPFEEGP